MVDEVARRVAIAQRAVRAWTANPDVAAALVAGSVARGRADALSDIELDVYWRRPPTAADRRAGVEDAGFTRVYAEEDEHEWADGVMVDGVKIDVSGFLTTTIDAYLDRALAGDTEAELQVRTTAVLDGIPLHGHDVIDAWRARLAAYPEALAVALVEQGLDLRSRERLEMLAERDDVFLLHRDLVDDVQGVLDALFGLNRVWMPHPFHKWLDWEESLLAHRPERLAERIRALLVAPPHEAVELVASLVDDTYRLAAQHVPAADLAPLRAAFELRRVTD
ncbi:DUF4037 domain-containing protein [Intrasporangium sp. YIM S08009]|uniref:DUF4037 domain-containing protein n=1 Tax=Intrasporangium zincisolvens TaxID=3080018 RepID=UPI002B058F66|nr:hypothetical protein [Intrasporangium sp. YIM S08009]